jgi:hypothetical protein
MMKVRFSPKLVVLALAGALLPGVAFGATGPTTIPLHVEGGDADPRLAIDVLFGTKPVRVLFDTGSLGLRLLASAVPADAARRTGSAPINGYGTGLMLHGDQAMAALSLGDPTVTDTTQIEVVDSFSCSPERPRCPAADGGIPVMFGRMFPGILGAGNGIPPRGGCCTNPFDASGAYGKQYIVHSNFSGPNIVVRPDAATIAKFSMVSAARGVRPYGCIRLVGSPNDICGGVLFDTGTPQIEVVTNTIADSAQTSGEIPAKLTLGTWSHTFAGGKVPVRVNLRRGNGNRIIIGLSALQSVDVFYDLAGERMGFLALE